PEQQRPHHVGDDHDRAASHPVDEGADHEPEQQVRQPARRAQPAGLGRAAAEVEHDERLQRQQRRVGAETRDGLARPEPPEAGRREGRHAHSLPDGAPRADPPAERALGRRRRSARTRRDALGRRRSPPDAPRPAHPAVRRSWRGAWSGPAVATASRSACSSLIASERIARTREATIAATATTAATTAIAIRSTWLPPMLIATTAGAMSTETRFITLISGLIAGPAVSLNGSPTVSPMTAAAWASEPLPPWWPSS